MNDDLEYVNSLEKELDELESEKADFSNIYDLLLEEYIKAQMQDKNMGKCVNNYLVTKGKSVETQFDKPSVVRQLNAQRIPKPSVLGKPTPFSNSPEMRSFQTKQSVNKTNVSDGLFKTVTQQNLPKKRNQASLHSTSISRPQLKCYQVKEKVMPNISQVKFTKKEVEDHHRISSISKKTKSVTACNDSSNSRTSNVNAVKLSGTVVLGKDTVCSNILWFIGELIPRNVMIKRVYYVEGLNHNLFSVGQFCDADLEVAFRKSTCFVRDLQGNDLLTGSRGSDLYTISLQETTSSTPICFMAKASPTQAWLWHRRLSHLNFDYITLLSKKDIVTGLPKLKYVKDQLCSSCEMGKAKRSSFKTKAVPSSKGRLNLLHMDLCGPMRVASINGKKYILVIVDDYSRYTWTLFLRSKDETPEVLKDFLTMIQRNLQAQVITVRTDRGTEFLNKTLHAYFKEEGIKHQTSIARTPEQNGVVERRNRTLAEAAGTMLSASKLPLSFWAEAASYYDNSDPVPTRQNVVPTAKKTDSSQQGLEFLFSPLLEEYYNPAHGLAEDNNNDQAPNASFQEV
ncbi:retrovirus-related pol polyprotein from transposon TNT 1-94 [Tanacetum coccineum]